MKKSIYTLVVSLLFGAQIKAQTLGWSELGGENSLSANLIINSICSDAAGNIYAAGAFYNGNHKRYVAKYDGANWSVLGGLNSLNGNGAIGSICNDAAGNIYAAGLFTNDSGKYYVAKYDGTTWSELGGLNGLGANALIYCITCDKGGNIYAAGFFTNDSGKCYVAKYNGTTWSEVGGLNALAANGNINCIAFDTSGNIYAAGTFYHGQGVCYVAKYDGTSWSKLGGLTHLSANSISMISSVVTDVSGNVYAGGYFTDSTGKTYVAKYNGTSWSEMPGATFNSTIFSICIPSTAGQNMYVGGNFSNGVVYDSGSYYVAAYNGSTWSELGGLNGLGANGTINTICTDAVGNIYAAGYFTNASHNYYVAKYGPITSINKIAPTGALNLFPNPTNNTVTVSTGSIITNASIKVYNITGQVVIDAGSGSPFRESEGAGSNTQFTIDLSNQSSGIYFVEVRDGENVWTGKVVKIN